MSEIYMYTNGVGGRVFPPVSADLGIAAAVAVGVLAAIGVILTVIAIVSKKRGEKEILSKLDDIWKEKASSKEVRDLSLDMRNGNGLYSLTDEYLKSLSESSKSVNSLVELSMSSIEDHLTPDNLASVVSLEKDRARYVELQKTVNVFTIFSSELPKFTDKVFSLLYPPEMVAAFMFPACCEGNDLFAADLFDTERVKNAKALLLSVIYALSFTEKHPYDLTYEDIYKWFMAHNATEIKEEFETVLLPGAEKHRHGFNIAIRMKADYVVDNAYALANIKRLKPARNEVMKALRALRDGKDPTAVSASRDFLSSPQCLWREDVLKRADRLCEEGNTKMDDSDYVSFISPFDDYVPDDEEGFEV